MEIQEMINVMQACARGEKIQSRLIGYGEWCDIPIPTWDFTTWEYRKKPEPPKPKYVPFETSQEVFDAMKVHGEWIENDQFAITKRIFFFSKNHDDLLINGLSASCMLDRWHFLDGTPFGKEVTE